MSELRVGTATGSRRDILLLVLAYIGFVSLGLPDAVTGVAWPSVRAAFELRQGRLGLVLIAAGCGYFLSSFFTWRLVRGLGIGSMLALSSALLAGSNLGFALAPVWPAFVTCALLHGIGSGAIDGGLNSFVARSFSARHMNWLHACYSLGAMIGPVIMTAVLDAGHSWRFGYAVLAGLLVPLAVLFAATRWQFPSSGEELAERDERAKGLHVLRRPVVQLQVALFFVYTGLEVTVGQWSFTLLTESRGVDELTAGLWVGLYWGSIGVGRVLFGFVVERVGVNRLLRASMLTALLGAGLFAVPSAGPSALVGLMLIGLALAPVYPCLMSQTPQRLGPAHADAAIGFQVSAAMAGAAALPALVGIAVEAYGLEVIAGAAFAFGCVLLVLHEALLKGWGILR